MNYAKILKADIANGVGFRVTLYVSGCARHCKGCFNEVAQDEHFGKPFDDEAKEKIFNELKNEWCKGLSFLGGEPLSYLSDNRKQVIAFAKEVKEKFPDKDIWLWTGYTFEDILKDDSMKDIVEYADYIIDGPFEEDKKDISLKWKGSSNQRVIDMKKYRETKKIVEI